MKIQKRSEIEDKYKWDLTDVVKDEKELEELCKKASELLTKVLSYKKTIMKSANTLYDFLKLTDELGRIEDRLYVYVSLKLDEDTSNKENQRTSEKIKRFLSDASDSMSFITPEILETPKEQLKNFIKEKPELKLYEFDLEKVYRTKEHTLDEKTESILSKSSTRMSNASDIYYYLNNTDAQFGIIKDEQDKEVELTSANYSIFIESKNRTVRENAFKELYKFWSTHKNTVSAIYKAKISESYFYSELRGYKSTLERYLTPDRIPENVYENLINSVHKHLDSFHKFQKLKKDTLKLEELHMYDVYVSIIEIEQKKYTFEDAKNIVLEALKPLGETYINDLKQAFIDGWIDVFPNKGKRTGAYSWGCYDSRPKVLLNFVGEYADVSTLAHELGHAMHTFYSNKYQEYVYSSYPIFLAEIASTVNEVLLNDYFYKQAKTNKEKAYYINELLELIKSTIYRQTMFAEFELIMHKKYQDKTAITEELISNTYYNLNKEYYGEYVVNDEEIKYEWERIPHFYTPFYVYKYATGLSVSISIANDIINQKDGSLEKYLRFLKSGCSKDPLEILKDTGIDLESGKPIEASLKIFETKLKELEELLKEI